LIAERRDRRDREALSEMLAAHRARRRAHTAELERELAEVELELAEVQRQDAGQEADSSCTIS
jgi:hypothetical protein